MDELQKKLAQVRATLQELGSVVVAFSGGVDSSLLLRLAHQELDGRCLAITAYSHSFPEQEREEAHLFCESFGIRHCIIENDEFSIKGFSENPPDRCYLCKHALFTKMEAVAAEYGIPWIIEGSNLDDDKDYRPGIKAVREHGVKSPLLEAGLTKAEIRSLSTQLGLATADKLSFTCLSTRLPYGEEITIDKLERIKRAEQFLRDLGFRQLRVRSHLDLARIEVDEHEMPAFSDPGLRKHIHDTLITFGFKFVSVDLLGYKSGSLNI